MDSKWDTLRKNAELVDKLNERIDKLLGKLKQHVDQPESTASATDNTTPRITTCTPETNNQHQSIFHENINLNDQLFDSNCLILDTSGLNQSLLDRLMEQENRVPGNALVNEAKQCNDFHEPTAGETEENNKNQENDNGNNIDEPRKRKIKPKISCTFCLKEFIYEKRLEKHKEDCKYNK